MDTNRKSLTPISDFGDKQLEMIKYFCDFVDDSNQLDEQLNQYYTKYTEKLGFAESILILRNKHNPYGAIGISAVLYLGLGVMVYCLSI